MCGKLENGLALLAWVSGNGRSPSVPPGNMDEKDGDAKTPRKRAPNTLVVAVEG